MPPTDNILSPETATARAAGTAGSMVITLAFTNNRSGEVGRDMGPRYQKMARRRQPAVCRGAEGHAGGKVMDPAYDMKAASCCSSAW